MEKLTLEHLAGYLPYGLKVKSKRHFCKYGEETILKVNGIAFQDTAKIPYWQYEFVYDNDLKFADINKKGFKPILRPLSDLTKEITHNREAFVPYNLLEIDSSIVDFVVANNQPIIRLVDCEFIYAIDVYNNIIQKLQSWHFDIHGLIDKNLAIDINTL